MQPSRNNLVDISKCVDTVGGNQFELVIIAADRAREIAQRQKNDESIEVNYPVITALLEIQNNNINQKQLKRFK